MFSSFLPLFLFSPLFHFPLYTVGPNGQEEPGMRSEMNNRGKRRARSSTDDATFTSMVDEQVTNFISQQMITSTKSDFVSNLISSANFVAENSSTTFNPGDNNVTCQASYANELIVKKCIGKRSCNLTVDIASLGSPRCKSYNEQSLASASPASFATGHGHHLKVTYACVSATVLKATLADAKVTRPVTDRKASSSDDAHPPPKISTTESTDHLFLLSSNSSVTGKPGTTRSGIQGLRDILASTSSSNGSTYSPRPTPISELRKILTASLNSSASSTSSSTLNFASLVTTLPPYIDHSDFDQTVSGPNLDGESKPSSLAAAPNDERGTSGGSKLNPTLTSKDDSSATGHSSGDRLNKSPVSQVLTSTVNFVKGWFSVSFFICFPFFHFHLSLNKAPFVHPVRLTQLTSLTTFALTLAAQYVTCISLSLSLSLPLHPHLSGPFDRN